MATFLNTDIENSINWKFLLLHILFTFLWALGISIVVFRIDLSFSYIIPNNLQWIIKAIPIAYFVLVLLIMILLKWYYNIALILYPILIIFWFFPKLILSKGKIYLFSNYINSIVLFFKKIKRSIAHLMLFSCTLLLILITNITAIRIIGILVFSYFYFRFVVNYIRKSFNPPKLFGTDIEKFIENIILSSDKGMFLINAIEEQKQVGNLSEEDAKKKKLEKLFLLNFFIVNFKDNLLGFKGKKAFVISWIYQLIGFFVITIAYYTFTNYELYQIDNQSFIIKGFPGIFDFFYYTIKTITFGSIEIITPSSILAMTLEIMSFLTLGIFLLIIVISVIFSLRQDRLTENVKKATELCIYQNNLIDQYIKDKYQTDIHTIMKESANIKSSLESIKQVITKLF